VIFEARGVWPLPVSMSVPASFGDILSHALLIHNITTQPYTINASFWSLGLEWQWYIAFPLVVLAYIRAPRLTLVVCAAMALFWGGVLPELLRTDDLWSFRLWLPARLFEFSLGIASAELLARKKTVSAQLVLALLTLGCGVVVMLHLVRLPLVALLMWGPIWVGILLLSFALPSVQRWLSIRLLTRLGLISYSVYLIHMPVAELVNVTIGTNRLGAAVGVGAILVAAGVGLVAGALFFAAVERPLLNPHTWERYGPYLLRWFGAVSAQRPRPTPVAASNAD